MATFDPLAAAIGRMQINEWRAHDDLVAGVVSNHGQKFAEERGGLFRRLVHLPVGSD